MKYRNYKSAIHNFTHSFISIDYVKSGRLAINVIIALYNLKKETKVTFDFLNKTIQPIKAEYKESIQLLNDYLNWLPDHFANHNCDFTKLKKLEITIWTDFNKAYSPSGMNYFIEFTINASTKWKTDGKEEQTVEISQTELINRDFLKIGIPEMKN